MIICFVVTICLCISLAGCNNFHAVPLPGQIEGLSMAPGLADGEVISWLPAQTDTYQRYGRVVCRYKDELITKRIMGLPGESIRIADGEFIINGEMLRKSPRLLQHFGLIVDCQSDSWRDTTQSWEHSSNNWVCEHVSSKHVSWLHFHPKTLSGLIPDGGGVLVYDDVSCCQKKHGGWRLLKMWGFQPYSILLFRKSAVLKYWLG